MLLLKFTFLHLFFSKTVIYIRLFTMKVEQESNKMYISLYYITCTYIILTKKNLESVLSQDMLSICPLHTGIALHTRHENISGRNIHSESVTRN